jgi:hypothetical protein
LTLHAAKGLIILLAKHLRETMDLPKTHRIDHLWRITRAPLERAFPDDDKAVLANAERVPAIADVQTNHVRPRLALRRTHGVSSKGDAPNT